VIMIERFLICDGCGENYGVDNRGSTGASHRRHAANDGWTYRGGKDYCPECSKLLVARAGEPQEGKENGR